MNNKKSWIVRITRSKEELGYYRTFYLADLDHFRWEKIVRETCEVVKNESI